MKTQQVLPIDLTRNSGERMNPLTLSFPDKSLEHVFLEVHAKDSLPFARFALLSGAVLYALFGVLDSFIPSDNLILLRIVRYGIVCPIVIGTFAATYIPKLKPRIQSVLLFALAIGGAGILFMIVILESPAAEYYYAGLILVLIYAYTLCHLRFIYATQVGCLLERYRRSNFYQAETIRSLASHDALTGLWNRRIMMERLTEEAARIHRYGGCSSIIEIDLDNFKTVNDTLGHSAGDNVLREFASLLVKLTRETDYAFRFGGDEFILLVPGTRGEQAAVIADKAMYEAKSAGKANIVVK